MKKSAKIKPLEINAKNKGNLPCFQLFPSEILQYEFMSILKRFIEDTNFCINQKKKSGSLLQNSFEIPIKTSLESQKYIILTRVKISLLICLLSSNPLEINFVIGVLLQSINNENETMNDYMKKQILDAEAFTIIFPLLNKLKNDFSTVSLIADILLNMSSNGEHYKDFILEISQEERVEVQNFLICF